MIPEGTEERRIAQEDTGGGALTTSSDERDRVNSFDLGVAGYMIKPVDYIQFVEVVRTINLYWTLSELPD